MARTDILDPVELLEMEQAFAQPATGQEIAPLGRDNIPASGIEITDGVITARRVDVARDDAKVLRRLAALAAAASGDWFYRFPVKKKGGGVDHIEGPSIKCANSVARCYGNCQVDTRVVDAGQTWVIYARFVDYETGFSMTRPFQQDKAGSKLGGDDQARKRDIALQIGVSKAIRNVVVNALSDFADYAFEEAKKNLVGRVGKNMGVYKTRIKERLDELGVDLSRVEAIHGRKLDDWLATDVALIIAEIKAVNDGMATPEETWSSAAPPEPRRSDATMSEERPPAQEAGPGTSGNEPENPGAAASNDGMVQDRTMDEPPKKVWRIADTVIGQDAIEKAILELVDTCQEQIDLIEIERQNADKLAKFSMVRRSKITKAIEDKAIALEQSTAS